MRSCSNEGRDGRACADEEACTERLKKQGTRTEGLVRAMLVTPALVALDMVDLRHRWTRGPG